MANPSLSLPISGVLPALRDALGKGPNAVLVAPPGAGKTTMVPLALRDAPWLGAQRIVMLEPRRLATRNAAHRMAALLGERVGETVGYRMRRDTQVSARTRIEVVTEGVLTRMIASDPTLDGVGCLIFDEFHERSLHADVGLALALHTQRLVRDELRLLVMSATLAAEPVARLLGHAPVITSEGRSWPVDVRYAAPRDAHQRLEGSVVALIQRALRETPEGDVLAFLPGQAEIARVQQRLADDQVAAEVHPLWGSLSFAEQDRALQPSPAGRRKVILATSIAESSLTIDGVRIVVDSGVSRVPRFSPRTGMTRLETVRVSRASADQRAGRAGRQAPGVAWRLWDEGDHAGLLAAAAPEIAEADLAPLALELAVAGVDVTDLAWLTPPPPATLARARVLLQQLDALDANGRVTPHGRELSTLGTHPRIAHMLRRAVTPEATALACDLAALLEERDILQGDGPAHDADLRLRVELVRAARRGDRLPDHAGEMRVRRDTVRAVAEAARAWRRQLDLRRDVDWTDDTGVGRLVALAFPDRVAQRRGDSSRYLLRSGGGVVFRDSPALAREPWLVVAETDGRVPEAGVYLAAPLTLDDVRADFTAQVTVEDAVAWDATAQAVRGTRRETLGALVLHEAVAPRPDPALVLAALRAHLVDSSLGALTWSDSAVAVRQRLACVHHHLPEWPDVSDAALLADVDGWLLPHLDGVRSAAQLAQVDLGALLLNRLDWSQRSRLEALVPTHYEAPTGSRLPIDYADPAAPVLRVRLQEMFGLSDGPRVLEGRVTVVLHLLSPAHRPLQVTRDLAGFWRSSYRDVQKEMKGRYPRHYWPDNPLEAEPTRRAKPRSS
ncbi:MAG: ATP-dependent helicase HrpB [Gemmatimonadetes bacterium]|nr:ATP-dependent helicase HrpB [Gemmatimonadota bacterium]